MRAGVVAVAGAAALGAGLLAAPAASAVQSAGASGAVAVPVAAGPASTVQAAAAAVRPGRLLVRVEGKRFGRKARVTATGVKGSAKGVKKTVVVKKRTTIKGLKPGRYRIRATAVADGGRTVKLAVKPRKVKVTRTRGAAVTVRHTPSPTAPLSTPPTVPPSTPPTVPPSTRIVPVTITAGYAHTCGLDTGGAAWCWGYDGNGGAGDGNSDQGDKYSPVAVAGGHTFTAITAGGSHTCALDVDEEAWCWGNDSAGQVGDGGGPIHRYEPVAVAAPTDAPSPTDTPSPPCWRGGSTRSLATSRTASTSGSPCTAACRSAT